MTIQLTRRQFLTISAAACGMGTPTMAGARPQTRWRGTALGAAATVRINGLTTEDAAPIMRAVQAELHRLEGIFSLYRQDSLLVRLNEMGHLAAPPAELLEVLSLVDVLHRATGHAFDPTVQSLFKAHAQALSKGRKPSKAELTAARQKIGWDGVSFDQRDVRLHRSGAALTLNGVAQGYVTDKISRLLAAYGLRDILVDAGEISARGQRPGGGGWTAGVADPDGCIVRRLTLSDRALATSAPKGTVLDPSGELGHIFDPERGLEAKGAALVAVSAESAALADGLSTALCVMPVEKHEDATAAFPGARLEVAI